MQRKISEQCYEIYRKIAYNLPNAYIPLPPLIIWSITYNCNLRCKMCPYYGEGGKLPDFKKELSLDEIKEVIDDIKRSYKYYPYKPYIGIIGGEPFIHPNIFEVLA